MDLRVAASMLVATLLAISAGPAAPAGSPAVGSGTSARAHAPTLRAPAEPAGGLLDPPLRPPTVLVPFDAPPGPYAAGHRGVDLAASVGVGVSAPADGVVVFAGRLVDRGVVSIDHGGGLRSSLEPVTATVAAGARVTAGQQVGTVAAGHARCVPAVCVHWGVRLDGVYLDPMTLLAPVRVRLLPWDG